MSYSLTAQERKKVLIHGQRTAASRRKEQKLDNRGRPIKETGVYYTHNVLLSDRLWLLARKHRRPQEPLGSALERLVDGSIDKLVRKKVEVPSEETSNDDSILVNDDEFKTLWKELDS